MKKYWLAGPALLVLFGLAGAVSKLVMGEHALGTTSAVPWGILIAGYVFFAASATGVTLVSSLGHVFGIEKYDIIYKRSLFLALALLLPGFGLIGLELGNPFKLIYIFLSPNFSSGIWWMGTIYSIYMGLLIIECYFSQYGDLDGRYAKAIGSVAFLTKIAAVCNLGGIFALLNARPFWHGYFYPAHMLVTAVLSGAAMLAFLVYLAEKSGADMIFEDEHLAVPLGKIMAGFLVLTAVLTAWKMYSGLQSADPGMVEATRAMIEGPLAVRFWLFEVVIGLAAPLALVLLPGGFSPVRVFGAAAAVMIGVFFMRADFVFAGQIAPLRVVEGIQHASYHAYSPSLTEWGLILGAFGGSVLLYIAAEYYFRLDYEDEKEVFAPPKQAWQSLTEGADKV